MKFQRYERFEPLVMTTRKISAFSRKQANEQARYPLFSDHVASEQKDIETEIAGRVRRMDSFELTMRAGHSRTWRQSRARFFSLDEQTKAGVRQAWKDWTGPRTSSYFASLVDVLSGDQARRLAKCRQAEREYMAKLPPDPYAATRRLF